MFKRVEDLALKENLTTDERREYERNLKHYQDYYSSILYASKKSLAQGIQQGIQQGRAEGLSQGRAEERKTIIAQMKACGMSDEQISLIMNTHVNGDSATTGAHKL